MKKLSKIHIILVAMFVVVLAMGTYFSIGYRGVEAKQPEIRDEITMALMRLETIQQENNIGPLKEQLAALQVQINKYNMVEPLFPKQPATVDIGDLVIDSIEKLKLNLLTLKSNDNAGSITIKSDKDDPGNKYSKAEYQVKVRGDLGRINSLIGEIEGAGFATLTVEDLKIEFKEKTEEDVVLSWWEAEFVIVTIYQYQDNK